MTAPDAKDRGGRTWRGLSAEERRAERRSRLIEAGIELFGTRGYAHSPVKAVCAEAGLTERYFYEAFEDREDLLAEIFDGLVSDTQARALAALENGPPGLFERLSRGLEAFFTALTEDPRRARIQEIETVGVSERMETRRREALHSYARLITDQVRQDPGWDLADDPRLDVLALGLVGAVNEQLVAFVLGDLDLPATELLDLQKLMMIALVGPLLSAPGPDR